jgi:hypothetical protein
VPTASGGEIRNEVSVDFTKIEMKHSRSDTVHGAIYSFEGRKVVKIGFPIVQYILIDSFSTLIYNPGERAGVQIRRKNITFLPFFQTFIGFFQGDKAFPLMHLRISASTINKDTLRTRWVPEDKSSRFHGFFEMVYCNDVPISVGTYDKKEKLLSQMLFSCDTIIAHHHVPLRIKTVTINNADTMLEDVTFHGVKIRDTVPGDVRDFKMPADVPVRVVEW